MNRLIMRSLAITKLTEDVGDIGDVQDVEDVDRKEWQACT
jgi:hypothetical protein